MTQVQLHIGFLVYPGVLELDVMAPYQVLSFPPNTKVHLLWKNLAAITSNEGLTIVPTTTFEQTALTSINQNRCSISSVLCTRWISLNCCH